MSKLDDFTKGFVTASDGTKIGYRQTGTGPGIILVHGGLQSSLNFTGLAKALSSDFTVYIPDRRGRGLTGAYGDHYNLALEADDVLALVRHTGTHNIFGLSSGAIVTLQAALLEPALKKVVLYEPPIPVNGNPFKKLDRNYERAMREGNLGKAFVAILKGTGDASFLNMLPDFLTAPVINMLMKAQMKNRNENELPLQELVPTFHYDLIIMEQSRLLIGQASNLQAHVLLLGGSKSQKFFIPALEQLYGSIPNVRRIEFKKLGHLGADNEGKPPIVAHELIGFFKT